MAEVTREKLRGYSRGRSLVSPERIRVDRKNNAVVASTWIDLTAYDVPGEEREPLVSPRVERERRSSREEDTTVNINKIKHDLDAKDEELVRDIPINLTESDEVKAYREVASPDRSDGPIRLWESEPPRPEHPPNSKYHKALERLDVVRRRTAARSAAAAKDTDILTSKHEKLVQKALEYRKNTALNEIIHVENEQKAQESSRPWKRLFIDTSAMEEVLEDKAFEKEPVKDFMSAFSYEFRKRDPDEQSDVIIIDDILPQMDIKRKASKLDLVRARQQNSDQLAAKHVSPFSRVSSVPPVISPSSSTVLPSSKARRENRFAQLEQHQKPAKIDDIRNTVKSLQQKKSAEAQGLPMISGSFDARRGVPVDAEADYVVIERNGSSPISKNQVPSMTSGPNTAEGQRTQVYADASFVDIQRSRKSPTQQRDPPVDAEADYRDIKEDGKQENSVEKVLDALKARNSPEQLAMKKELENAEADFLAMRKKKPAVNPLGDESKLSREKLVDSSSKPCPVANVDASLKERAASPQHARSWKKNMQDRRAVKEKVAEIEQVDGTSVSAASASTIIMGALVGAAPGCTEVGVNDGMNTEGRDDYESKDILSVIDGSSRKSGSRPLSPEISSLMPKHGNGHPLLSQSNAANTERQNVDFIIDTHEFQAVVNGNEIKEGNDLDIGVTQLIKNDSHLPDVSPNYVNDLALSADDSSSSSPSDVEQEDNEIDSEPTFKSVNEAQANDNGYSGASTSLHMQDQHQCTTKNHEVDSNGQKHGCEPSDPIKLFSPVPTDLSMKRDTEVSTSEDREDNVSYFTDNSEAKVSVSIVDSETTDSELDEEPEAYDTCAGVPFAVRLLDVTCAWLEREESSYCIQPSLLKKVTKRGPGALGKQRRSEAKQLYGRPPVIVARVPRPSALSRCFGESRRQVTEKKFVRSKAMVDARSSRSDDKVSRFARPRRNHIRGVQTATEKKEISAIPQKVRLGLNSIATDCIADIQDVVTPISSNVSRHEVTKIDARKAFDERETEAAATKPARTANTAGLNELDALHTSMDYASSVSFNVVESTRQEKTCVGIFEVKSADEYSSHGMSALQQSLRARSMSPRTQRAALHQKSSILTTKLWPTTEDKTKATPAIESRPLSPPVTSRGPSRRAPNASLRGTLMAKYIRQTTDEQDDNQKPIDCTAIAIDCPIDQTISAHNGMDTIHSSHSVSGSIDSGSVGGPEPLLRPRSRRDGLAKLRRHNLRGGSIEDEATSAMPSGSNLSKLNDEQRLAALDLAEKLRLRATTLKRRRKIRERRKELRSLDTQTAATPASPFELSLSQAE